MGIPTGDGEPQVARRWSAMAAAGVSLIAASDAHAYLDGGTGSMMLQLLLGGVAGVGVIVRLYWHRLLGVFGVRRHGPTEPDTGERDPKA